MITSVNLLTAIVPGSEGALTTTLRDLPRDVFTDVVDVHFARWVVLGQSGVVRTRHRLRMKYLLFTAAFDGDVDAFAESLRCGLTKTADDVWGQCVGYPSWRRREDFHAWFAHNLLPVRARFAEWPDLSPSDVRSMLQLRRRHIAFAVRSQGADDETLRTDFLTEFGR